MDDTLILNKAYYCKIKNVDDGYFERYLLPNLHSIVPEQKERDLVAVEETPDGKFEIMVIFTKYSTLQQIIELFNSENLVELDYDMSDEILFGNILDPVVGEMQEGEFKHLFEEFRRRMTSLDIVLDKIGMGKELDLIDREVLKQHE